ncbi:MAG TPA: Rieske 2Fe-2S domain-containing protein [Candidatus Limnocylindrales bacterium]|nr:Rieske 2Fe-2S domain-containing protein [Candidatus Limnocylindrales bacterium]
MTRITLPPYPNGWFNICYSHELEAGQIKAVRALGRDFVVFRGEGGTAHVLDAYCPHLGAHLGVGGKVEGDNIRCPFHAWCWSGESGQCVDIPYAKRIPPRAAIGKPVVREQNGFIIIWNHAEGAAPQWTPEMIPETSSPDYHVLGRRQWELTSHPQELYENGFDVAHFGTLHKMNVRGVIYDTEGPICKLHLDFERDAAAQSSAEGLATIRSFMFGPGLSLTRVSGLIEGVSVQSLTPIEPERMLLTHNYYVHNSSNPETAAGFYDYYAKDWELDMPLWNNKLFRDKPVLAEGDGDISRFRKWYRQFYSTPVEVAF